MKLSIMTCLRREITTDFSSVQLDFTISLSEKILRILEKHNQKSSNTQKHRELQLTVFLGFQAACV
ncbi:hypothetical protein, partial [Ruthenibacterium lactatiformans]